MELGSGLVLLLLGVVALQSVVQLGTQFELHVTGPGTGAYVINTTAGWACDDLNNCTKDFALQDHTCTHEAYTSSHACQDACYVEDSTSTYCDPGTRTCVGQNMSECLGYCDDRVAISGSSETCDERFPFLAEFWENVVIFESAIGDLYFPPTDGLFDFGTTCEYNECHAFALGAHTINDDYPSVPDLFAAGGALRECLDYLDQDYVATHKGCIIADMHVLDYAASSVALAWGDMFSKPVVPFLCTYRYACSTANYTQVTDSVDNGVDPSSLAVAAAAAQRFLDQFGPGSNATVPRVIANLPNNTAAIDNYRRMIQARATAAAATVAAATAAAVTPA
jgi:hypothetical protein